MKIIQMQSEGRKSLPDSKAGQRMSRDKYTRSLHNAIFGTRKTLHYARTALSKTNFTSANFHITKIWRHYKRFITDLNFSCNLQTTCV